MRLLLNIIWVIAVIFVLSGCSKKETPVDPAQETPTETTAEKKVPDNAVPAAIVKPMEAAPIQQAPAVEYAESGIGMKAAALEGLTWIKGDAVTFETGKVYVVEFWATWCGPCRTSIPHLTEIQAHYKDAVTVIGISDEDQSLVRPFVENMGDQMDYTVASDTGFKAKNNYSKAFGQNGIPHAFVIDKQGRIVWVGHPLDGMDEVLSLVVEGTFDSAAFAKQKAERQALEKQLHEWYSQYFTVIHTKGIVDETTQLANSFIEKAHPEALNAFAWNILTLASIELRQLDIALKAAEKANQLTENNNPMIIDTYALALFENGKIKEAITHQQKAVELFTGHAEAQADMTKTLDKYKAALEESGS